MRLQQLRSRRLLLPIFRRTSKTVLLAYLVLNAASLLAAEGWHSLGNVSAVKVLPTGVDLNAGRASIRVVALSGNVVRVRYAQEGQFPPDQSFAVLPGAFPNP